ncbi:ketosynthase chain-length factor [Streptomyces sp. NPDC102283]|uniref:ketosynthase chain-length factor n=1 Tax=Streptomyces sp. NPDC102283 TaxID=3366155 RepID=UPI00380C5A4A
MTAAVVTGIGVAAPTGLELGPFWEATLRGRSGIRPVRRFDASRYPATLAGEIADFVPEEHLSGRLIPQTDRMTQLTLAASDWALADAGVRPGTYETQEMGVATSAASGGFEYGQRELAALWSSGPAHVSVYMSFAWFYAVNSGQLSIRHGMRGPSGVLVSDQAGGLDAFEQARRNIRKGTPMVLCGGVESSLNPYGWVARMAGGGLSTSDDPKNAYRPFAPGADGHVPGEGGAILVVEDAGRARDRGARVYGEIAGYAATFDAAPRHGGACGLRRAMEEALADSGTDPSDIGVVFADGAGTPAADRAEAEAVTAVFGPRGVPVSVPKALTGRMSSGAAPVDVACALLSLRDKVIPPTADVGPAAPEYDIDLVTGAPRPWRSGAALVLARGAGGFNAATVLRGAH